jgi:hypothetical protein
LTVQPAVEAIPLEQQVLGIVDVHHLLLLGAADVIDEVVVRYPLQPGREGNFSKLKAAQVLERLHEHLFRKILSGLGPAVQVICDVAVDLGAEQLVQLAKSCPVVGLCPSN